jgi:hypothetical protein
MKKTLTTLALILVAGTAQAGVYAECLKPEVKDYASCTQIEELKERVSVLEETLQTLLVTKAKADKVVAQPKVEKKPTVKTSSKDELELVGVEFGRGEFDVTAVLKLDLKNNTNSEIVAWKGNVSCLDAFGDEAFSMKLNSKSANILPGKTESGRWSPNMFGKAGSVIKNNDAKNFTCSLKDVKLVK